MREIKFRGKRVDNGGWVYGGLIECSITGKKYIFPLESDANESSKVGEEGCLRIVTFEVIPETVGQFTGLKDKNGKVIYEGDIVKDEEGRIAYIVFLKQEMGYVMTYKKSDHRLGHRNRKSQYDIDYNLEIIGNIYENPELLEDNNENN